MAVFGGSDDDEVDIKYFGKRERPVFTTKVIYPPAKSVSSGDSHMLPNPLLFPRETKLREEFVNLNGCTLAAMNAELQSLLASGTVPATARLAYNNTLGEWFFVWEETETDEEWVQRYGNYLTRKAKTEQADRDTFERLRKEYGW